MADGEHSTTYRLMQHHAGLAAWYLDEAWKHPVRHSIKNERAALYRTHRTVADAKHVLARTDREELFIPDGVDADSLYQFQAGVRTIAHLLPPDGQRYHSRLVGPDIIFEAEFWRESGERAMQRAPEVFTEWHGWIWNRAFEDGRMHDVPSPEAKLLAAGLAHLAASAETILEQY